MGYINKFRIPDHLPPQTVRSGPSFTHDPGVGPSCLDDSVRVTPVPGDGSGLLKHPTLPNRVDTYG